MTLIFHITARAAWQQAQRDGAYRAESLAQVGFIHFSGAEQVVRVANALYSGQGDLVLLVVDPARLNAGAGSPALRYETPADMPQGSERFPHLYGALNLDAVLRMVDFPPDAGGGWSRLPPGAAD